MARQKKGLSLVGNRRLKHYDKRSEAEEQNFSLSKIEQS